MIGNPRPRISASTFTSEQPPSVSATAALVSVNRYFFIDFPRRYTSFIYLQLLLEIYR